MRQMWLQDPSTNKVWNLLPENPYDIENGCPFISIKGMGYEQDITQKQVEVDYFISEISSKIKRFPAFCIFTGPNM